METRPATAAGGLAQGRAEISVVMPVRNAAPMLAAAIDSLLRQTDGLGAGGRR